MASCKPLSEKDTKASLHGARPVIGTQMGRIKSTIAALGFGALATFAGPQQAQAAFTSEIGTATSTADVSGQPGWIKGVAATLSQPYDFGTMQQAGAYKQNTIRTTMDFKT